MLKNINDLSNYMTDNQRKAFDELKKIGCPVFERASDNGSTFHISGEDNDRDTIWADYYEDVIDPQICRILSKYDLIAEWEDPGSMTVWE